MKSIALRFAENFAPECGTIAAHQAVVDSMGSVWYGKFGSPVSEKNCEAVLAEEDPMILLIHSGGSDRWWAHIDAIQRTTPPEELIPEYYKGSSGKFSCWFHVTRFERASHDVMAHCLVPSSGRILTSVSRHSMSPYFIINYEP